MNDKTIAVFDVETTGIYTGRHDRIIEIAIVLLDSSGNIQPKFDSLVNPERDLGPSRIHRISSAEVLQAPTFQDIADDVGEILAEADLVAGHNVSFDKRFLLNEFKRAKLEIPDFPVLCTCRHYARSKLHVCCQELGISMEGMAHRALTDAIATAGIVKHLVQEDPGLADRCLDKQVRWPNFHPKKTNVYRREHAKEMLDAPPQYLTRLLNGVQREWNATDEGVNEYLDLIERILEDRTIDHTEEEHIVRAGVELQLSQRQITKAHEQFLYELTVAAWEDGVITPTEKRDLFLAAKLLGQSEEHIESLIKEVEKQLSSSNIRTEQKSKPKLEPGLSVCFTGELLSKINGEPITRSLAIALSKEKGFEVKSGVSKKLDILIVADPNTQSGKAKKARDYGLRIMSDAVFFREAGIAVQ